VKRGSLLVAICVVMIGVGGCSRSATVKATPNDRAACVGLGVAYRALNAWNGGPSPSGKYRWAITVAGRADNRKFADAIADWMTAVLNPATAPPGPDAAYATEECRAIGSPLQMTSRTTGAPSPSSTGSESSDGSND
jgi:hypothetical protein